MHSKIAEKTRTAANAALEVQARQADLEYAQAALDKAKKEEADRKKELQEAEAAQQALFEELQFERSPLQNGFDASQLASSWGIPADRLEEAGLMDKIERLNAAFAECQEVAKAFKGVVRPESDEMQTDGQAAKEAEQEVPAMDEATLEALFASFAGALPVDADESFRAERELRKQAFRDLQPNATKFRR